MIINLKYIGEKTEYNIIAQLYNSGFIVLKPLGDNQRYDLVLDVGEFGMIKCQCKTSRCHDSYLEINTCSTRINSRVYIKENYKNQCDYFLTYCYETSCCYFYPVAQSPDSHLRLRFTGAKNNQNKKINLAVNFELNKLLDYIIMSARKEIF